MKLSKRLDQIKSLVGDRYDHIWDCCCDHGLLGAALLQENRTVHFVDIVPKLMAELEQKLLRFHGAEKWQTHCLDVAKLPLAEYAGRHLIIIAGVGGDLMQQFIVTLQAQYRHLALDFLLCPVHHQFALRQQLAELDFGLRDEALVEDNRRYYEVLLVANQRQALASVSAVGDKIWQQVGAQQAQMAADYHRKTVQHYQRIQRGNTADVQHIIDAYQRLEHQPCFELSE
uniref:tRNA (adenine(22)-N(1))-methyltransferase n=1 Tax=Thaumasiovibrio occultus TaxID=1891184 RepID=UPI000B34D377|nr:tRNA (adenine(22)-N(1))-methyltransferase TrmK [Thaumasiovibrio occultus]